MHLDRESLAKLRTTARRLGEKRHRAVPHEELVALAESAALPAGVTIDFGATAELGEPMIVLRVPASGSAAIEVLSPREREVAALVAAGLANKEIAVRLGIALSTVKDHLHRILRKTGLPNRAAVAAATREG